MNLPRTITVNGKSNIHRYRPDGVKTQDRETRTVMTTVTSVDSSGNTVTSQRYYVRDHLGSMRAVQFDFNNPECSARLLAIQ